jgi:Bacterial membrane protein YfhO
MKYSFYHKIKDYLFLFLVALIAYWPVSFMVFSLKNDAINYFLAMRVNTSEAIQNNFFPSWSAFINMGYPMHADMQSGVWNPLVFLMSLIRKYDIYWLHAETILIILLSGISMYQLLKYFKLNRHVILAVSAAYMMNGYITDAGQFMNWLYAAALLPLVFLCAIRCFTSFRTKDAFLLGLSYSFMLLCSYPADFIILTYILIAFILVHFIRHKKEKQISGLVKKYGRQILIAAITFTIICLPAILSYIPFINSISRGTGVTLETALSNSLAPANLVSFVTPWATQKGNAFEATDPLIRNCYMGIILFIFFIFFLVQKKQKTLLQKFLLFLFIIFINFSFGEIGGLRVLSYNFLPLMDTFRHPANAKLFFIFSGQILAAFAINEFADSNSFKSNLLKKITTIILIILACAALISFINSNIFSSFKSLFNSDNSHFIDQIKIIKDNFSFYDLLFLNSIFIFIILLIFYRTINKAQQGKNILYIILIEMFIITQGMLPLTYVRKSNPSNAQQIINQQPGEYPLPDATTSIESYSTDGMKYFDQIGCLNPYNKKPGRSDYIITPSNLSTQEYFWDYYSFRKKILQYPLAYFTDTIYSVKDTAVFVSSSSTKKACIVNSPLDINFDKSENYKGTILFKKFVPGAIELETESAKGEFLVLLQNKYDNWYALINGNKTPIIKTNLSFMGIQLPPGKNKVEFIYKTRMLKYLSIVSIIFILTCLLIFYFPKKQKQH